MVREEVIDINSIQPVIFMGNKEAVEIGPQEEAGERYYYYMSDQVNSTRVAG